jgi:chromosome segregation ATPase
MSRRFLTSQPPVPQPRVPVPPTSQLLIDVHQDLAARPKQRPITKEDIVALKQERQKLLDERTQLKTKIARLEVQSKRSARTANTNPQLLNQLDREYMSVEHMIMQQRAQINELLMSDNAAQRQELQEEAKIIYQERMRLQELQVQQQIALNDAKRELAELMESDGPAVYERQAQRIEALEEKLKKYEHANSKLAAKVKSLKAKKALEEESAAGAIGGRTAQLRAQIREAEKATEEIEAKITQSVEKHKQVMKALHLSLLQRGIDTEET